MELPSALLKALARDFGLTKGRARQPGRRLHLAGGQLHRRGFVWWGWPPATPSRIVKGASSETGPKDFICSAIGRLACVRGNFGHTGWCQCRTGAGVRPIFHHPGTTHENRDRYPGGPTVPVAAPPWPSGPGVNPKRQPVPKHPLVDQGWLETALFPAMAVNCPSP